MKPIKQIEYKFYFHREPVKRQDPIGLGLAFLIIIGFAGYLIQWILK